MLNGNNNLSSDEDDGCEDESDVEDWMFQTFTGAKKVNQGSQQVNRDRKKEQDNMRDLDGGLGGSYEESSNNNTFDMPSEMMSK